MDHDHHAGMNHGDMDHDGSHGGEHNGDHTGMGHMSMTFHFSVKETILFNWWKTTTAYELLVAVFIVAVIAALYEGIKYSRERLLRSSLELQSFIATPGSTTALHGRPTEPGCMRTMFSCAHFIQTLLHAVQFTISYMLMLVFMTYNVYLCMAVVTGATIGYFLFGWRSTSVASVTEHCE